MPIKERAGDRGTGTDIGPEVMHDDLDELELLVPVVSCAIDDVALAALRDRGEGEPTCSVCDGSLDEDATSSGLFMWARGEELRFEEPPLCSSCARNVGVAAFLHWPYEDELD